jgi:hypothetical protein
MWAINPASLRRRITNKLIRRREAAMDNHLSPALSLALLSEAPTAAVDPPQLYRGG